MIWTKLARRILWLLVLLVFAACGPQVGGVEPRAWMDAPLEGSTHPPGVLAVMAHAGHPEGIDQLEFVVGEEVMASGPPDSSRESLARSEWSWSVEEPGIYILKVRARTSSGVWSSFDQSRVTIVRAPSQEPSPTSSQVSTPSSTITPSPTYTPSPTATASATTESGFIGQPILSTNEVRFDGGCQPGQVTWQVAARHPSGMSGVFMFHRVEDADGGSITGWSDGRAMSPVGGDTYALTMTGDQIADSVGYTGEGGRVQYQIVILPVQGENARSPVYSNLNLKACGIIIIIPPIGPLPTITPTPVVR